MAPVKRNHKTLSLKEKSAIIDELKCGVSGISLARKLVLQYVAGPGKRQTLKQAEYPKMESKLHSWFNDLEDGPEDLILLSVMLQKIRSLAEEIDVVSSMFHSIGNVDIDAGETIDWIDSDAKLIERENLIHANNSADSDDDVMEIATPSVPKILKQGAQTSNEADEINVGESDEKVN
ncbi:hypothetical protein NQ314_018617 [Rhamnusium bicolor]|uniref:Uncharacterized protein n=1 Tax=Rhamnusium bicolor TaxID=1586634 RepID=A0AAV8WQM6_9CUCU|nr:hypothetical protein NQ314_018617 [Rhamnusium bicolor]